MACPTVFGAFGALHVPKPEVSVAPDYFFGGGGGAVQTKMSWRSPLTSQCSRYPLGIKVQSCPVQLEAELGGGGFRPWQAGEAC